MRRRAFLGLAGALGTAAVTGACGVPSTSDPIRLGNAPSQGPPEFPVRTPPSAEEAKTSGDLVAYFLNAAAGGNTIGGDRPEALGQAKARLMEFFTEAGLRQWQPGGKVLVVRAVPGPPQSMDNRELAIDVACVPLGYLDDWGDVSPVPYVAFHVRFTVVSVGPVGSNRWRIDALQYSPDAPLDLLLADTALREYYDPFNAYFWDPDVDALVPELRYMPAVIPSAKRPAEIVRWLKHGPSSWLSNILKPLPQEIDLKDNQDNPHWDPDTRRLTVNLSSKAANLDEVQKNFAIQVWWMLQQGTVEVSTVELSVEGKASGIKIDSNAALFANWAARIDDGSSVERFCIVDRKIREIDGQQPPLLAPVGNPNPNTDVILAAVTGKKRYGALVRQEGARSRLWLGATTRGGEQETASYAPTAVVGKVFSRPVWIERPKRRLVMIVVDGTLQTVTAPTVAVPTPDAAAPVPPVGVPVAVPSTLPHPITAVSVAPDLRRIVLIAGGQVIVAPIVFSDTDTVAILDNTFRTVYTPLGSQLAVGWGDMVSVVVGGAPGPTSAEASLLTVPLSSAVQTASARTYVVDQLSSYPGNANPGSSDGLPLIMIESNGQALYVFANEKLQNIEMSTGSTPSPSASASTTPPPQPVVSSPFFGD